MKEKLLRLLQEECPDIDFENNEKLVTDGVLDSVTTIEIISAITMEFNIEIPFEEYTEENFNSLDAIIRLIEKYM